MASTPPSEASSTVPSHAPFDDETYESIDLREVFARLMRGLPQILGLAALGLVIAAIIYLIASPFTSTTTSMRVAFAFDGAAQGRYPDHSKFEADDLRAPDVIIDALKRQGLETNEEFQGRIRGAVTVEGIIPTSVTKERDRLRAVGQTLPPYIPDEYLVTLTLPRSFPLTSRQRESLLNDIARAYQQKFKRTYSAVPQAFGNAFETLRNADYWEYDLVLRQEILNIIDYLNQQIVQAKTFRSPTTNFTFNDLLEQTTLFSQIRVNGTLGLIRENGLSRDRNTAMVKMDYRLHTLDDLEQDALEKQQVIQNLLAKAQERSQNVVLGIKTQAAQQRPEATVLDQGLVDSLLANDSYNFLVRKALDAGTEVAVIKGEKARLADRRTSMEAFVKSAPTDQAQVMAQVDKSLADLEIAYNELIKNIRQTYADFALQEFADAIRVTMAPMASSKYKPLAIAGIIGAFLGFSAGMGLSLLGIYIGSKESAAGARG